MRNKEIAKQLRIYADYLTGFGYKIKTEFYRKRAEQIENMKEQVDEMSYDDLRKKFGKKKSKGRKELPEHFEKIIFGWNIDDLLSELLHEKKARDRPTDKVF